MALSLKNTLAASVGDRREVIVNPFAFGPELLDVDVAAVLQNNNILAIPPVWAAVDFLAGTLATLPLDVLKISDRSHVRGTPSANLVSVSPKKGFTSFDWRYAVFKAVFTLGRHISYLETDPTTRARRSIIWELDPNGFEVIRRNGQVIYKYNDGTGVKEWTPDQVIDITWMKATDGLGHISPLKAHTETFQMAFAFAKYQKKFADSGGVPAFVLKARWDSPQAIEAGLRQFLTAVRLATKNGDPAVPIGRDMEISPLGVTPQQGRIVDTQKFIVRQICRIYNIPPIYLHDTEGVSFNNAEHQGLNLAKYTLGRWATQLEGQIDIKIFRGRDYISRHNMDSIMRGDYATRIEGHSTAINSGQLTPDEARMLEDRGPEDGGDELFMQSGTMPIRLIDQQQQQQQPTLEPPDDQED